MNRVIDGEYVPMEDMEKEGLKHVFMEIMERMRVEDMQKEGKVRFVQLMKALEQGTDLSSAVSIAK